MCDILLIVSEVAYTHFGENVYREPAEERLPAGFSFCANCGIIMPTKSTRPIGEAQEGGYLKGYGLCRERHCLRAVPLLILDFVISAA